jgi:glycine cleavage system aminomethyltransferase T
VVRFEIPGKGHRPAKPGDLVLDRNGTVIGHVTSNAALEDRQVGLAYVRATYTRPGSPVAVVAAQVQAAPRVGDRLAVPVHGSIVERFLRKG